MSRLRPRIGSYEKAVTLFKGADFELCLHELSASRDLEATLLRSRANLRLGNVAIALEELLNARSSVKTPSSLKLAGELEVLISTAQTVLDYVDSAEESLTNARAFVYPYANGALEGEIQFIGALLSRKRGDAAGVQKFLNAILSIEESIAPTFGSGQNAGYPFSVPYWRSRAFEARALDSIADPDSNSRASNYIVALRELDRGGVEDRFIEASIIYNATVLVRESGPRPLTEFLTDRARTFPWSPGVRFFEFYVFHNFGLRCAYEGDHLSALRNLRRSAEVAPSGPLRLLSLLARYQLIFDLGESLSASEELDYALRLFGQIDWNATTGIERRVLLTLSSALADVDVVRARVVFDRYNSTLSTAWSIQSLIELKQIRASTCYAESKILLAEGQKKRAITLLLQAFQASGASGYERLHALTALELWEHTGEARYADIVSREALRYRDSILARRMRALKA